MEAEWRLEAFGESGIVDIEEVKRCKSEMVRKDLVVGIGRLLTQRSWRLLYGESRRSRCDQRGFREAHGYSRYMIFKLNRQVGGLECAMTSLVWSGLDPNNKLPFWDKRRWLGDGVRVQCNGTASVCKIRSKCTS